jgi:hypothetical protein
VGGVAGDFGLRWVRSHRRVTLVGLMATSMAVIAGSSLATSALEVVLANEDPRINQEREDVGGMSGRTACSGLDCSRCRGICCAAGAGLGDLKLKSEDEA